MKITHNKIGQNLNLTDGTKLDKASEKNKTSAVKSQDTGAAGALKDLANSEAAQSTRVDLSERSQDIRQIRDLAKASPDIDQAKVEKFQKLIDAGKYKIDAKAVADKMVDEQLMSAGTSND